MNYLLQKFGYSYKEWFAAKLCTAIIWLIVVLNILFKYHSQPFPDSICLFINCSGITQTPLVYLMTTLAAVSAILYVLEKLMPLTLLLMSGLSILVFSLEASNGTHSNRNELLAMVLIAQLIGYLHHRFLFPDKTKVSVYCFGMFYSVQAVAAAYVITAITKLSTSGFNWVLNAPNIAVRVIRLYNSRAIDSTNAALIQRGHCIANMLIKQPGITKFVFGLVLLVEFFALLAATGKKNARLYSLLLLLLHLGIFVMFGGVIINFVVLTLIYLTNIPGLFVKNPDQPLVQTTPAGLKTLLNAIFAISFTWVFIIASAVIGDHTPFSSYAMFSSADNKTDYYYITNKQDSVITPALQMRTVMVKDVVLSEATKEGINTDNDTDLKRISHTVLLEIISRNRNNPAVAQVDSLKLYRHKIEMNNNLITEQDVCLGSL